MAVGPLQGQFVTEERSVFLQIEIEGAPRFAERDELGEYEIRHNGPTSTFSWSGHHGEIKFLRIDDKIAIVIPAKGFVE